MEAIRASTLKSEQKSIEENICFAFCLTDDFYRFCRPYVLQKKEHMAKKRKQKKKRVKVRLNRRHFRWIFVDWLKSKIKKKKKKRKRKKKEKKKRKILIKKCGSNFCGEGNIGQKRTNFVPNFEIPDVQLHRSNVFINLDLTKIPGWGVGGLPYESDGDSRRKIQIKPLREINVVWLKGDFCVFSVTTSP